MTPTTQPSVSVFIQGILISLQTDIKGWEVTKERWTIDCLTFKHIATDLSFSAHYAECTRVFSIYGAGHELSETERIALASAVDHLCVPYRVERELACARNKAKHAQEVERRKVHFIELAAKASAQS